MQRPVQGPMDSIEKIEEILALRRRAGSYLKDHKSREKLSKKEVWTTNIGEVQGKRPYQYDLIEHAKDIEYTRHWFNIYTAFQRDKVIPERVILRYLISKAEDRLDQLEDALEPILRYEHCSDRDLAEMHWPIIDMRRWKFKYYERTLEDAKAFLDLHDEHPLYLSQIPFYQDRDEF
ncbi:hypothetical protein DRE_02939 [Drechslerella stenobrocha 248]|uniref:Uncharacterized protein n=1 Tax=Drechslerella stenobrocha 248 TaxID=1043628 RepID=W7HW31_9PEZI|nr:hypothetical protein DRE_02939 [Drechslerella stenobrocha 248]